MTEPGATLVDVSFALAGTSLPREHRQALALALADRLPWLAEAPLAGVHRINVAAGGGPLALLAGRSRLTLRVPRAQAPALDALGGARLDIGGSALQLLGPPRLRELLPYGALYAHAVAAADDDEIGFLASVDADLQRLGVACRRMCGRLQHLAGEAQALPAFSLMLDRLSPTDALQMLEHGVGPHRLWGCGLFVPHKSAAAVAA